MLCLVGKKKHNGIELLKDCSNREIYPRKESQAHCSLYGRICRICITHYFVTPISIIPPKLHTHISFIYQRNYKSWLLKIY